MAVIITRKRWRLGDNYYLDILRNDINQEVIFAVGKNGDSSPVNERVRFTLPLSKAMSVARFIANISSLDPNQVFEDADTDPG